MIHKPSKLTLTEAINKLNHLETGIVRSKTLEELRRALPIPINYPHGSHQYTPEHDLREHLRDFNDHHVFGPDSCKGEFKKRIGPIVEALRAKLREFEQATGKPKLDWQ